MSLLNAIKLKKESLRNTETIVTRIDGKVIKETKDKIEFIGQRLGFVADTKPDMIPVQIIKNLYLGAQDCCDKEILNIFNLKVVLSIGIEPPEKYKNITYNYVECLDLPETDLKNILDVSIQFLDQYIEHSNILVHCNAGVSRSASIVIGYLILKKAFNYKEALELCKKARSCVRPNAGFEKQLKLLSDSLKL